MWQTHWHKLLTSPSQRSVSDLFCDWQHGKVLCFLSNISPHKRYMTLYSYVLQMLGSVGFLQSEDTWGLTPCGKSGINSLADDTSAPELHTLLRIHLFCSVFNTGHPIVSEGCNNLHKMAKFFLKLLKFMAFTLANNLQSFSIDVKDEILYIQLALFW